MIQRPRLFTDYNELSEIMTELETLAMDLKTITVLQHDEKKNWELNEASEEIIRAYRRIARVYDQSRPCSGSPTHEEKTTASPQQDTRPKRSMTDLEKMIWDIEE